MQFHRDEHSWEHEKMLNMDEEFQITIILINHNLVASKNRKPKGVLPKPLPEQEERSRQGHVPIMFFLS